MQFGVNLYGIFLDHCCACCIVAFRFYALDFGKQSSEKFTQLLVIINFNVGLAVLLEHFNYIVSLAVFVAPARNESTVAHVGFLDVLAFQYSGQLGDKSIADIAVVFCLVGFLVGQKSEFNHLVVGKVVKSKEVGTSFFQCR